MLLSGAFWLYRISLSPHPARKQLMWFYGLEVVCLALMLDVLHHVCFQPVFSMSLLDHWAALNAVYLFPFMYMLFECALQARKLSVRTILGHVLPYSVFAAFVTAVWIVMHCGVIVSPRLENGITTFFALLMFSNVVAYGSMLITRALKCRYQVEKVFAFQGKSGFMLVRSIGWTTVILGAILYVLLCVGLDSLHGNVRMLVGLAIPAFLMIHFVGFCVSRLRGVGVPPEVDWSVRHLSDEQLETFERRFHLIDEVRQAQDATLNISSTLENWLADPHKPFLRQGITVNDVAEQTGVPAKILSTYLNKTLELNFNQWINTHRLKEVKVLLLSTDRTLDDIAADCGFTDRSAMSRIFKQAEGLSPTEFRNRQ